mmetsp:Transcript_25429/g.72887  ORF Transcript_25429/g.72887 Transcript_25429/m.72887 type:complete len:235 (+) Transcript_25429:629-1333(+)
MLARIQVEEGEGPLWKRDDLAGNRIVPTETNGNICARMDVHRSEVACDAVDLGPLWLVVSRDVGALFLRVGKVGFAHGIEVDFHFRSVEPGMVGLRAVNNALRLVRVRAHAAQVVRLDAHDPQQGHAVAGVLFLFVQQGELWASSHARKAGRRSSSAQKAGWGGSGTQSKHGRGRQEPQCHHHDAPCPWACRGSHRDGRLLHVQVLSEQDRCGLGLKLHLVCCLQALRRRCGDG